MNLFSPSVSWPWKGVAFLSRLLLWGVIGVWLVFAFTWGAIHWVIVPRIGEWRSHMETLATRSVGLPVRLGSIQAQSDGTIPTLEITDLRLLDAQGNDALLLHRVVVSLSVRSLWRLGFEQVLIERPELDIRRTTQGHIRIAGLQVGPSPDATVATRETVEAATSDETNKPASDPPPPPSTAGAHASEAVLDWLFSQPEFAIVGGRIRWTDEWQQQEPIRLDAVDFVLRNPGRRHMARLDATPSDGVSQRLSVRFQMRSPLLSRHPGRWQEWSGEAYGEFPGVNLARLAVVGQLAKPLGVRVQEGQGALRLWVQWQRGEAIELTSDLALQRLHAHWADTPHALELRNLAGRVQFQQHAQGWELATQGLNFRTPEGIEWKNGSFRLRRSGPSFAGAVSTSTPPAAHELEAKHINLAAVRELALGLPLPTSVLEQLDALEPQGVLETLQLQWTEDPHTPKVWASFQAKGQATGLGLKAQPVGIQALQDRLWMGRPGFQGANVAFEVHQGGGEAKLSLSPNGQLVFPGVFDEAIIPMQRFSAHAKWTLNGNGIQVQLQQIRFANADAEGQAQATWQTSDPHTSPSRSRFPGILQLEGQLSRGKGERVHRYLPRSLSADVRQYVKQSVLSAALSEVRFRVNGDLYRFPFENPNDGEFRIQAKLHQAHYAYLPPHLNTSPSTRAKTIPATTWPALRQLEGVLRFHGMGMSLDVQRALIDQAPGLRVVQGHASIAHFEQALLDVHIKLDGALAEALRVVHRSPLAEMTAQVLKPVRGTGASTIQLGLQVPLQEAERTQVKGQVQLLGNDVQWNPDAPMLGRVRGTVEFTHQGFWIPQASARLLGGEVQFSGGLKDLNEGGASAMPQFKAQGIATAEGLRQASFLGWPTALADHAQGQTLYTAQLGFKHGLPQIEVQTALQGMSLSLPAPMNKMAEALWPLQFTLNTVESANDTPRWQRLNAHLASPEGPRLALLLQRDLQSTNGRGETAFSRGIVRIGADGAPPASIVPKGWILQVNTPEVDVSAWQQWATQISKHIAASSNPLSHAPPNTNANFKRNDVRSSTNLNTAATSDTAWPERVWLKTALLHVDGRRFESVELEAQRQGVQWQANVRTRDMAGRFDYQMTQPGRAALLKARLNRLALQTSAPQVRHDHTAATAGAALGSVSSASPPSSPSTTSHRLPDLDVVIDALEIDGRAWGRLELSAANQTMLGKPPDWLLTQLKLRVPEAHLSATGRWGGGIQQRTELDFQLDVQDSGQLLRRFGMVGVFKGGKGQLMGHVGWPGSPLAMDSQQLSGQIELDIAAGQFLKADPGLAKLLGVLSLQSLPRRLALDFSDVFAQGFSFDFIRGDARIQHGVAYTNNLQMKGLNAAVLMEGKADIVDETQDLRVVVVPEINAGTASLIATVINPAIGLGTFLAQALLRQPLMRAATQEFRLHGTWADPQVDKINTTPASSITNAQSQ